MIIIGIDPGYSTGFAVIKLPKQKINLQGNYSHTVLAAGILSFYDGYKELLEEYNPDFVVIEDFKLYPHVNKKWDNLLEVRTLGVIEYITKEKGIPYKFQMPNKKWLWNDKRLETMGVKQKIIHANDAVRHVFEYMYKEMKAIDKGKIHKAEER
ncbi:crossover junction endodeoxyribonuclease [Oceanotoga phage vB_OteS-UFV02]